MPSARGQLTAKDLLDQGLDWLFPASFLGQLPGDDRDQVIAAMAWRDYRQDEVVIEHLSSERGVDLILAGRAVVHIPDGAGEFDVVARVGPGHLIGERSEFKRERTYGRVMASSPMRTLHITADDFHRLLAESDALSDYIGNLVALRDRSQDMLSELLRDPVLRSLGRDGLERFLQSGELLRCPAGTRVVSAGERAAAVYLLVKGKVAVYAPDKPAATRQLVASHGAGWFFGHASVLLDVPRTADIETLESTEVLRVSDRAFMDLIQRNPPLQRRLYQQLATLDLHTEAGGDRAGRPTVVGIWSARHGVGTTTLSYGVAATLRADGPVTLIDLQGARTAQALGLPVRQGRVAGVPVERLGAPKRWGLSVLWPRRPDRLVPLLEALVERADEHSTILLVLAGPSVPADDVLHAIETLVTIRKAGEGSTALQVQQDTFHIDAIRLEEGAELPVATARKAVRVADDAVSSDRFWKTGDLDSLLDQSRPLGRSCGRLVRVLQGRTVGIALGGGGALGFAHVGLIETLHAHDIPIDYVAGVSFGSVIGAVYTAAGLEGLHELLRWRRPLSWVVNACFVSLAPLTAFVGRLTGGRTLGSTEIPFYPVSLDVWTGNQVVLYKGTIAEGVRASSSFPGLFPAFRRGVYRLVDGGMVNNVPASVMWDAGADFIVASNIIPAHPVGKTPSLSTGLRQRLESATVGRIDDLLRSVYLMMSQTGRDRATLADYVYDFDVEGYSLNDFTRGKEIYRAGLAQARREIGEILEARASDSALSVGRR